jgi:magnesium transporter
MGETESPITQPTSPDRVQVILTSRTLAVSGAARRAAAQALAGLGLPVFFVAGTAAATLGPVAPWFVLVAALLGLAFHSADVETRRLNIPGGLYGSVRANLGRPAAHCAAATVLVERLLFGVLAAAVGGQYVMTLARVLLGASPWLAVESAPFAVALPAIGVLWILQRQGRGPRRGRLTAALGAAASMVTGLALWAGATVFVRGGAGLQWPAAPVMLLPGGLFGALPKSAAAGTLLVVAFGHALAAMGGSEALGAVAFRLDEPRGPNLRTLARFVTGWSVILTAATAFLFVALVPAPEWSAWAGAPLAAIASRVAAPGWLRFAILLAITLAAGAFLWVALRTAWVRAAGVLGRLSDEGVLGPEWRVPHHRFGTPWRIVDAVGLAQIAILLASGGQVEWLACAYGVAVACTGLFQVVSVLRFIAVRQGESRDAGGAPRSAADWSWALAVALAAVVAAGTAVALVLVGDGPAVASGLLIATLAIALSVAEGRVARRVGGQAAADLLQPVASSEVGRRELGVRPGGFLVPVRNPHTLVHLVAALRASGERDVVAMTVRLIGTDAPAEAAGPGEANAQERELLSSVAAVAERLGRGVRVLIVPAFTVLDAVIDTALRLDASEVHVGESATLSADDQARLAGQAWERARRSPDAALRLVVHHPRGGAEAYQLGAHPPGLQPEDLEHIHRLWLDVARGVGPHVHHRDVVRTALTRMEQELNGPNRDAVLQVVRETARPADAVAAIIRERDFGRLRDVLRNRPASDVASVLAGLSLDERVLVFRILPRSEAAAIFAYLSPGEQDALLRAMASEEAASLLNAMPPDDRTAFLDELPAEATRQLLALLTPEERAEAVRLLGYPENSVGRLMTPHYVAVHEDWTVQQVLDYVRTHGEDSETLNVLYVVDGRGLLIDDIRIREFLLRPPDARVSDLMDRRFVALHAADDQEAAVRVFKAEDRTALPVTDSAGVLIGIVTVDDVLDVAEQEATEDLQRFGGTEALDEPYMKVGFAQMIQKRAGWLTALFLGEMLTATAMGAFEREIERAVVLALFVPLIISSGGNSGSQASTLVIRALALGEVTLGDWWRVMRREFAAGLALGGILGSIGFLRITVWSAFSTIYGPHWLLVAITVALALVGIVLWGTLVGSLLPFGLRRLGFDPAASSAPFVATLVDVTGLVIYFSVGLVVLRGTLL